MVLGKSTRVCAINKAEAAREACGLLGLQTRGVSAGADGCCRAHPVVLTGRRRVGSQHSTLRTPDPGYSELVAQRGRLPARMGCALCLSSPPSALSIAWQPAQHISPVLHSQPLQNLTVSTSFATV